MWYVYFPFGYFFGFTVCESDNGSKSDNLPNMTLNLLHVTGKLIRDTDDNAKVSLLSVDTFLNVFAFYIDEIIPIWDICQLQEQWE